MLSLEDFKKSLGTTVNQLSEEEVIRLFELQKRLAAALFDSWLKSINNNAKINKTPS